MIIYFKHFSNKEYVSRVFKQIHKRTIYSVTGELPKEKLFVKGGGQSVTKHIEAYWKEKIIEDEKKFAVNDETKGRKTKYVLGMFPYPSGSLHMGHVRVYTLSDVMSKFYRMQGYQVFHPIGWDAFGLPAENAAIERGVSADSWTMSNIAHMKKQIESFGCHFNWESELTTCHPSYYKWTQSLFLKLYQAGLCYYQEAEVNWDPVDKTVLANEQVDLRGRSWRSGAIVEKIFLRQWFIQSSKFHKRLIDGLSDPILEDWHQIIELQKDWIGKGDVYRVILNVSLNNNKDNSKHDEQYSMFKIHAFIKRPELLHGLAFIAIRPNHPLNKQQYLGPKIDKYQILNIKAVNPINNKSIPIIVCEDVKYFALPKLQFAEYYCGVPSTSKEDCEIAQTCDFNYNIVLDNNHLINSDSLDNMDVEIARKTVINTLIKMDAGGYSCSPNSKDWLISRQRYWGTPIPMIHCSSCGTVPVPDEDLPVVLPDVSSFVTSSKITSLKDADTWKQCQCPRCGIAAERETDTLDTFFDSSWYFLRFLDSQNKEEAFNKQIISQFMPVNIYVGGIEHAILHLYYARFMQHFLESENVVKDKEPFSRLIIIGQVKAPSYKVKSTGKYIPPTQVDLSVKPPKEKESGLPLTVKVEKMSKSRYNGVDPLNCIEEFGIDSTRLMILSNFIPFDQLTWNIHNHYHSWQKRLWGMMIIFFKADQVPIEKPITVEELKDFNSTLYNATNQAIAEVTFHFKKTHYINMAITRMIGYTTILAKDYPPEVIQSEAFEKAVEVQVKMLAPIIPHIASELWTMFCAKAKYTSQTDVPLTRQIWPELDPDYELPFTVNVNGGAILKLNLPAKDLNLLTQETATKMAMANEKLVTALNHPIIATNFILKDNYNAVLEFKIVK